MLRVAILLFSLHGCCGGMFLPACGNNGPPPPDSCEQPLTGKVDTIEIGTDDEPTFVPYHDGDEPEIVVGGQGSSMMGIRLRLTGSDIPACMEQNTVYEDMASGGSSVPVKTYSQGGGIYTTKPLWIPGYFPPSFAIRVVAGGTNHVVHLGAYTPDLGTVSSDM